MPGLTKIEVAKIALKTALGVLEALDGPNSPGTLSLDEAQKIVNGAVAQALAEYAD